MQAAWDTSIARTIIIITFHIADVSVVILSLESISRYVLTVGKIQSQPSIKYQDPSLQDVHRTYSQLWCSHGQPLSFLCGRYCTLHAVDNSLLIMTISLSTSWGVAYRYLLPAVMGGWSCLSIPSSFTNWSREISAVC